MLRAAEVSDAWIALTPSLPSGFPGGGKLGAEGASWDPCVGGAKEPLVKSGFLLLVGVESRAPLPLGFGFLNFPNPCRVLCPAFWILSATRKNSLSLWI
ncbi:unnamed protein product [Sphagnum jensenii]|uniref:Uncharacterized protein n=1 Tax=Sphagnum jensenii TaxID=128206 RepID=A0ABP1BB45_9BRYO